MKIGTFHELYLAELQELHSVEKQLAAIQPRMAEAAHHPKLRETLAGHREETESQVRRLRSILDKHGADPDEHTDQAMQAMIHETEKMISMLEGDDLLDAGLIASAQKLAHYEIAAFGSAAALAGQLDLRDEQESLHKSLEEEKRADAFLTALAKREVNPAAAPG